jgi:hypothetical protein
VISRMSGVSARHIVSFTKNPGTHALARVKNPIKRGGRDGLEYREHGDDHGESAEHDDRELLAHRLWRFCAGAGARGGNRAGAYVLVIAVCRGEVSKENELRVPVR